MTVSGRGGSDGVAVCVMVGVAVTVGGGVIVEVGVALGVAVSVKVAGGVMVDVGVLTGVDVLFAVSVAVTGAFVAVRVAVLADGALDDEPGFSSQAERATARTAITRVLRIETRLVIIFAVPNAEVESETAQAETGVRNTPQTSRGSSYIVSREASDMRRLSRGPVGRRLVMAGRRRRCWPAGADDRGRRAAPRS